MKQKQSSWWRFTGGSAEQRVTGEFRASGTESIGRLYFPLFNTHGMLSWATPNLHGSPATGHNEYLGIPLSAEDFPHTLAHRGFWFAERGREPFSLSGLSPSGLRGHLQPARSGAEVEAGPGWFSVRRKDSAGRFEARATLWCPSDLDEKIELMLVEVTNTSKKTLRLDPYAAVPVFARSADNLRDHRHVTALLNRALPIPNGVTFCPTMSFDERGHKENHVRYSVIALGPRNSRPRDLWTAQDSFLGEGGTMAAPAAVWRNERAPKLTRTQLDGCEAIAGFRFATLVLKPGATSQFVLVAGVSEAQTAPARWQRWASRPGAIRKSLEATKKFWSDSINRVCFHMADPQLDQWLGWVNFQPTLRRFYGNSYLPQFDYGRGGRGWRDLWQDCLAMILSDPSSVRRMLLSNYGGVRIDGSNATIIGRGGTFLADRNNIPRTWMDHGCWPTYTTLLYVDQTGDLDFVLQRREYFRDPQIFRCHRRDLSWTEKYGNELRNRDGEVYRGTIFEHMLVQNLTAFFNVGDHNVCRLEGADWNDGMDMAETRGESVAFSAFYAWNLDRIAGLAESLGSRGQKHIELAAELAILLDRLPGRSKVRYESAADKRARLDKFLDEVSRDVSGRAVRVRIPDLARDLREKSAHLKSLIREQEWVKLDRTSSCFNGYYDNHGSRVEGPHRRGVRMTLTGQVFALMSGLATDRQIDDVIAAVNRHLRERRHGGIRLNTDFGDIQPALGRAFSFAYGEKENGAVFSHMAVMYAFALYARRRPEAGRKVWHALYQLATDQSVARIFPCLPEYFNSEGRGLYCYLTGSASWMNYLLLTQVYGVRGDRGDLVLDPQLTPEDFDARGRASVRVPFAERDLLVTYVNADGLEAGRYAVQQVVADGISVPFSTCKDGGVTIARGVVRRLDAVRLTRLSVILVKA